MSVLKQAVSANSKCAHGVRKQETTDDHGQHSADLSFLKMDSYKVAEVDIITHLQEPTGLSLSLLTNAYEWLIKSVG